MSNDSTADDVLTPRVLREYALVADGERGALIAPDGSVAWLCVPRWDSPAAFSGLLGGPGRYTVTPADRWHVWGGYYENGTLIWRSRWVGDCADRVPGGAGHAGRPAPGGAAAPHRGGGRAGAGHRVPRRAGRVRPQPDDRGCATRHGGVLDRAQRRDCGSAGRAPAKARPGRRRAAP